MPFMAKHHPASVFVPVVQAVSLAEIKISTCFTNAGLCPVPITHHLKFVFPYFLKIIGINVSLHKTPVDVRAGRNRAVNQNRSDIDTGTAEKITIANLCFVITKIPLATEFYIHLPLFSFVSNKVQ